MSQWDISAAPRSTRLNLVSDSPLDYQVELSDPQTVVLHLYGLGRTPPLPALPARDSLIRSVETKPNGQGIDVVLHTAGAGLTVMPFYEAASRRLTLELGGTPAVEPPPPPAAASAQGSMPAEGAASVSGAMPPPPGPKARGTIPSPEDSPEPPAASPWLLPANPQPPAPPAAPAAKAPVSAPAPARAPIAQVVPPAPPAPQAGPLAVQASPLRPPKPPVPGTAPAPEPGPEAGAMAPLVRGTITMPPPEAPPPPAPSQGLAAEAQALRQVLAGQTPPPPPAPPAAAPAGAAPAAQTAPAAQDAQAAPAAPAAAAQEAPAAPAAAAPAAAPAAAQGPTPKVLKVRLGSHPDFTRLVLEADAPLKASLEPSGQQAVLRLARGVLAPKTELPRSDARVRELAILASEPLGLGLGLARPLGPHHISYAEGGRKLIVDIRLAPPGSPVPPVVPAQAAPAAPAQAAKAGPPAKVQEAMPANPLVPSTGPAQSGAPATINERPPQAAKLGPEGQEDAQAKLLLAMGKEQLNNRRYPEAAALFKRFLEMFPQHPLAQEAQVRLADAIYHLREPALLTYYPEVMQNYQKALDNYPDNDLSAWAEYMMGKASLLYGLPFKALGYFDLVTQDHPKSDTAPMAMLSRGQTYLAEQKYNQALAQYKETAQKYPDASVRRDAEWGQAQALFGLGAWGQAAQILQDMQKRYPDLHQQEPESLYYVGEALFQQRDYAQARSYYLWALNLKPDMRDNDIIMARVGDTYKFEGEARAAQEVYRQVVSLYPDTDGALVARIRLAEAPAKDDKHPWDIFQVLPTEDARDTYQDIADQHADRPVGQLAMLKLGVYYYRTKDYPKALEVLNKLAKDHPGNPFKTELEYTLNLSAMALLDQLKEQNKPLELMTAFLRYRGFISRPNSNEVLSLLAWAYEQTGLSERAARTYRVLLARGLKDAGLKLAMARNLMAQDDYAGVSETLGGLDIRGLKPAERLQAMSLLGRALEKLGHHPQAQQVLDMLAKADPEASVAQAADYQALGQALAAQNNDAQALEAWDQADKLLQKEQGPTVQVRRYLLGMDSADLAQRLKAWDRALAYLEQAQKLAPSDRDKAQAIYETTQVLGQAGRAPQLEQEMDRLAKLNVAPWSQMAERHLADLAMAARMNQPQP